MTEEQKEHGDKIIKPLKLSEVRRDLPIKISKNGQFDWFETLMGVTKRDLIDFDVFLPSRGINLQRPLVWSANQKQQFIMSILKEIPIPKVSIIQHWDMVSFSTTKIEVIDGKQRMCAFRDFCLNLFPLESGHYFSDMDKDCKMCIYRFYTGMDCCTLYNEEVSDKDKVDWFMKINFAGTPQEQEHFDKLRN